MSKEEFKELFKKDAKSYRVELKTEMDKFSVKLIKSVFLPTFTALLLIFVSSTLILDNIWFNIIGFFYGVGILVYVIVTLFTIGLRMFTFSNNYNAWAEKMAQHMADSLDEPEQDFSEDDDFYYRVITKPRRRKLRIEKESTLKLQSHDPHLEYSFGWGDFDTPHKRFKERLPVVFYLER
jgi:ABC-type multidrug transport system fused ATPase/permease subunit